MSASTNIEWTDRVWNPLRGCLRVSPGCVNCYAERQALRYSGKGGPYEGLVDRGVLGTPRWTGEIRLVPEKLDEPLRWKRPQRVFVNSMSDLFHEEPGHGGGCRMRSGGRGPARVGPRLRVEE